MKPLNYSLSEFTFGYPVLTINRRCAIPVAWKIVKGTERGSWKPYWKNLFESLQDIVPQDYLVTVSADRGCMLIGCMSSTVRTIHVEF